jgi:hypothetical protein
MAVVRIPKMTDLGLRAKKCLTSGPPLSLCAHGNGRFRLPTPGQRPEGLKRLPISPQNLTSALLRQTQPAWLVSI